MTKKISFLAFFALFATVLTMVPDAAFAADGGKTLLTDISKLLDGYIGLGISFILALWAGKVALIDMEYLKGALFAAFAIILASAGSVYDSLNEGFSSLFTDVDKTTISVDSLK